MTVEDDSVMSQIYRSFHSLGTATVQRIFPDLFLKYYVNLPFIRAGRLTEFNFNFDLGFPRS